jgi:hypothetical protein
VDEELIALVVEGEVEVDQFVEIEVLQPRVVRDFYAGNAVFSEEGTIVLVDLGEEQVDLVLEHELVQIELHLKRRKQLFRAVLLGTHLNEMAISRCHSILIFEYQSVEHFPRLLVEPACIFARVIAKPQLLHL